MIASMVLLALYNDLSQHRILFDRGLARFGIDPGVLDDVHGHIRLRSYVQIFEWLAEALGDPWLGLRVASRAGPHALGALGYLFLCSRSLEAAFWSASRYLAANQTASSLDVRVGDGFARVRYRVIDESIAPRRQDSEYSAAITWRYMRILCNDRCRLNQVRFEHDPPAGETSIYRRVFNAPVLFGQSSNELIVPLDDYRRLHPGLDPHLLPILEDHVANTLPRSGSPETFARTVEESISGQSTECVVTASQVAQHLGIAPVTLHRRLRREGRRFKAIVEARSKVVAERLLTDSDVPIAAISQRLGFANPETFTRACHRWFGKGPREYRKLQKPP